jgi:H+/Cl- antiporter ClcA
MSPNEAEPTPKPLPYLAGSKLPWIIVAILFVVSICLVFVVTVVTTAQLRSGNTTIPWWFHPLVLVCQIGIWSSFFGVLILVIISFRRFYKYNKAQTSDTPTKKESQGD